MPWQDFSISRPITSGTSLCTSWEKDRESQIVRKWRGRTRTHLLEIAAGRLTDHDLEHLHAHRQLPSLRPTHKLPTFLRISRI